MGERKGQNMYYPPDYDPGKGGLNKSQGTHALRERARKLHLGILIIRFEMPYNIWCEGCGNHIGMGVRYNAEKKKVGMYYTTPIYLFRMKCHLCDNHFEIKTDPGNLDYEIISGARRQEKRFKAEDNGTVVPDEKSSIAKMSTDSMFKLKHEGIDKRKGKDAAPTIAKIVQIQDRAKDDYEANRQLRDAMRLKRKASKSLQLSNSDLMSRSSLQGSSIALLPEDNEDSRTAALMRLAPVMSSEEKRIKTRKDIMENESIFTPLKSNSPSSASTVANNSTKAKKIESFRKMVKKKKQNELNDALSLDLGIRKHVSSQGEKRKETESNKEPDKILSETIPKIDINKQDTACEENINLSTEYTTTQAKTSQRVDIENSSKSKCHENKVNELSEQPNQSSLSLLSFDYQSSSNSSDND